MQLNNNGHENKVKQLRREHSPPIIDNSRLSELIVIKINLVMKKYFYTSFIIVPISLLVCFAQCKKENTPLTITLYDKPLTTIQSYIQGKWKLHYSKGGICAICEQRYDDKNVFYNFTSDNRIQISSNGRLTTDTTINWVRDRGTYTNGYTTTFIMNFYNKQNVPWNYVVDRIFNDTLVIHDNSSDAVFYHFTKF